MASKSPAALNKPKILLERYKFSTSAVLGEGTFAHVYKGLDIELVQPVAVKMFNAPQTEEERVILDRIFKHSIEVQQAIKNSSAVDGCKWGHQQSWSMDTLADEALQNVAGDNEDARKTVEAMDLKQCFLRLIDYSKDKTGKPGLDEATESYFLITEIGEISLADYLSDRAKRGAAMEVEDLRQLHWNLISIVCGLHAAGFVHMDIKPCNIMRVQGCWKLIDFDGAVRSHTSVNLSELLVTPIYAAPEVAAKLQNADGPRQMEVSRLMDVWSLGMCALECIFLEPILATWYVDWEEETGSNEKFLTWLADCDQPIMEGDMTQAMVDIDPDMADLFLIMLQKDPSLRSNTAICICHKWFEPIRLKLWAALNMDDDEDPVNPRRTNCQREPQKGIPAKPAKPAGKASKACSVM